jgi:hypothetical protein
MFTNLMAKSLRIHLESDGSAFLIGNPKPLLLSELTFAETDRFNVLSQKEGPLSIPSYHKQRACVALPLFHVSS